MTTMSPRQKERAERLQLLANQVTLARLLLVATLAAVVGIAGRIDVAAVLLVVAIWLTDVVDGPLARLGRPPGMASRPEGQALDPVVDDFAYAIGFVVLFGEELVPLALLTLVIATRCIFTVIRITGLAMGRPFAKPRVSGKAMGVSLGLGQIALFAAAAGVMSSVSPSTFKAPLIWAMGLACVIGLVDFLYANRAVVADVLVSRERAPAAAPAEPRPHPRIAVGWRPMPLRSATEREHP